MIGFLAGVVTTVLALCSVAVLERVFGWPDGHVLRRFGRRVDRLRRRALRTLK